MFWVGEAEGAASAVVAEGVRPSHEVVFGRQLVSGAAPVWRHQHLVQPGCLLLDRQSEGFGGEQMSAIHLADQGRVHTGQPTRGADAIGSREFRGLHLG